MQPTSPNSFHPTSPETMDPALNAGTSDYANSTTPSAAAPNSTSATVPNPTAPALVAGPTPNPIPTSTRPLAGTLAGTLRLIRFIARRDRLSIGIWLVSLLAMTLLVPVMFQNVYNTTQSRVMMAETLKNPAMVALVGPVYGGAGTTAEALTKTYTIGAMDANEMLLLTMLAVGLMNVFFVVRYTRKQEDLDQQELIRALPVGRLAPLHATLMTAVLVNLVLGIVTALGLTLLAVPSMNLAGNLIYAAELTTAGIFAAALAAVAAQLASTARTATSYSLLAVGGLYCLRAVGDIKSETLARISPLGLLLRAQAYVGNHWWPIAIVTAEALILAALAYALCARRDMGQGLIPARSGRAHAPAGLSSSLGLAWRLSRTTIIAWLIGMLSLGLMYGSLLGNIESFIKTNAYYQQLLKAAPGQNYTESFISLILLIMGIIAMVPPLMIILKAHSEEKRGRTEIVLATASSRPAYLGSYTLLGAIAAVLALAATALGFYVAGQAVMKDPIALSSFMRSSLVNIPAIWFVLALSALALAALPRLAPALAWSYFSFIFGLSYLQKLLKIPVWIQKCSPLYYLKPPTATHIDWAPLITLTVLSAVLILAAAALYRARDLQDS